MPQQASEPPEDNLLNLLLGLPSLSCLPPKDSSTPSDASMDLPCDSHGELVDFTCYYTLLDVEPELNFCQLFPPHPETDKEDNHVPIVQSFFIEDGPAFILQMESSGEEEHNQRCRDTASKNGKAAATAAYYPDHNEAGPSDSDEVKLFCRSIAATTKGQIEESESEDPEENFELVRNSPSYNSLECQICSKQEPDDTMLICDKCDQGYHLECIGIPWIPAGEWICQTARMNTFRQQLEDMRASSWTRTHCPIFNTEGIRFT